MNKEKNARREFLKKVAYKAPVVIGLGMLIEAEDAQARAGKTSKVTKNAPKSTLNHN